MVPVPNSCSLNVNVSGASSNISSNLVTDGAAGSTGKHRRQSSVNVVSWNETVSVQCAPDENTDPADEVGFEYKTVASRRRWLTKGIFRKFTINTFWLIR